MSETRKPDHYVVRAGSDYWSERGYIGIASKAGRFQDREDAERLTRGAPPGFKCRVVPVYVTTRKVKRTTGRSFAWALEQIHATGASVRREAWSDDSSLRIFSDGAMWILSRGSAAHPYRINAADVKAKDWRTV